MQIPSFNELIEPCIETLRNPTQWNLYRTQVGSGGNWSVANAGATFTITMKPSLVVAAPPVALEGCYLRCHGFSLEKAERASHVSNVYSGGKMLCIGDYEAQYDTQISIAAGTQGGNQLLEPFVNLSTIRLPSSCAIAVARNTVSFGPCIDVPDIVVANGQNLLTQLIAISGANTAANAFQTKNRFTQILPILSHQIFDGNESFTPRLAQKYMKAYQYAQRYQLKCDINAYRPCIIPLSMWPLVTEHGLGHVTFTNFSQPSIQLSLFANPITPRADPLGALGCEVSAIPSAITNQNTVSVAYDTFQLRMSDATFASLVSASPDTNFGRISIDIYSISKNYVKHHMGSLYTIYSK